MLSKHLPCPISFNAIYSFLPLFAGIIQECIITALKSATFSAPESSPKTSLETMYFMLHLKILAKNLENKLVIMFVLME